MQPSHVGQHQSAFLDGNALNEMARRRDFFQTRSIWRQDGERGKRDDTSLGLRFGVLPRTFEAPSTKAVLSSKNSNRFLRLSVDRQA